MWAHVVSNPRTGKQEWNPYKAEHSLRLHCAHCNLIVGAAYPEKRLYKLFYIDLKGAAQLGCRPAQPFVSVSAAC